MQPDPIAEAKARWNLMLAGWGLAFKGRTPDIAQIQLAQAILEAFGFFSAGFVKMDGTPLTEEEQAQLIANAFLHGEEEMPNAWKAIQTGDANAVGAALMKDVAVSAAQSTDDIESLRVELGLDHTPTADSLATMFYKAAAEDAKNAGVALAVKYKEPAAGAGDEEKSSKGIWIGAAILVGVVGAFFLAMRLAPSSGQRAPEFDAARRPMAA